MPVVQSSKGVTQFDPSTLTFANTLSLLIRRVKKPILKKPQLKFSFK